MKTHRHKSASHPLGRSAIRVLGLLLTLFVWRAISVDAQGLDIPAPQSQGQTPFHYHRQRPTSTPTPQGGSQVRTIPPVPMPQQVQPEASPSPPVYEPQTRPSPPPPAQAPPSRRQPEPVLPAIFRGCWQGEVRYLDSIERLPGGAKIGSWTPKTYRLCYRRLGDGPFELTLTEAGIAHNSKITNPEGRMQLLSTDGRSYASMRAFLHFDEYRTHTSYFGDSTFAVDEVTKLDCDIEADGMHVWGQVFGRHGGDPWFRAWWHTVFVHTPEPPETERAGGIPE
jgi:hypothetical protein